MRWEMDDIRNDVAGSETEHVDHLQEAKYLLGHGFPEDRDAIDVIKVLLVAANELGKSRVIGWDIAEAAQVFEKTVGVIDISDIGIDFILSD